VGGGAGVRRAGYVVAPEPGPGPGPDPDPVAVPLVLWLLTEALMLVALLFIAKVAEPGPKRVRRRGLVCAGRACHASTSPSAVGVG
jgi:hypothetical protein